ncbi:NlpC/P60 family protein [Kutzneria sp. 744]|uniref:NlpC/P60 family protein n=1 Tax=Kutzneria sp. (strain 744) TaxID=345341 RepID=UPI0003EEC95C|nr:NlpC/P60 family protein [Kutzneria sp. 744]EWM18276.1 mucin-2 [Kutzneria sp. 744]
MKHIRAAVLLTTLVTSGAAVVHLAQAQDVPTRARDNGAVVAFAQAHPTSTKYSFVRLDGPARTAVLDEHARLVAMFTDGARTAVLGGQSRTFSDPQRTSAVVTTSSWVRLAPQPWKAGAEKEAWFRPWLDQELTDRSPDVLAVATQYVTFAHFADGADYSDFLGITVRGVKPRKDHFGDVDSAGYVRLVYGYRLGFPVGDGGLPRTPQEMPKAPLGAAIADNAVGSPQTRFLAQPGDLLLFSTDGSKGAVDHVGIYLGVDDAGQQRFIASRGTPDGPSFGDSSGRSVLDDDGPYAAGLWGIRRL